MTNGVSLNANKFLHNINNELFKLQKQEYFNSEKLSGNLSFVCIGKTFTHGCKEKIFNNIKTINLKSCVKGNGHAETIVMREVLYKLFEGNIKSFVCNDGVNVIEPFD